MIDFQCNVQKTELSLRSDLTYLRGNRETGGKASTVTTALSSGQRGGGDHPALLLCTVLNFPDFSYKELRYFCDRQHA